MLHAFGACRKTAVLASVTAVVLALVFLALQAGLPWNGLSSSGLAQKLDLERTPLRIHVASRKHGKASAGRSPRTTILYAADAIAPSAASKEGNTSSAAPERPSGFGEWLKFARENKCVIDPYERISRDLGQFAGGIGRDMLEAAKATPNTVVFRVEKGFLSFYPETEDWVFELVRAKYSQIINTFVQHLPDMEFVVNEIDEPRVLPGTEDNLSARYDSQQCANASDNFQQFRHLHGFVISPGYEKQALPRKELLPIFSQSKIDGCFADIGIPTWYNLGTTLNAEQTASLLPWDQRIGKLFFRGSTTGGKYNKDVAYSKFHRQRLVDLARHSDLMDCQFTSFLQCEEDDMCTKMEEEYGRAASVPNMENFNYKYLMGVDGNTFVSRTPMFLSSGSLLFRTGIFNEWFDDRLKPFEHFIPVKLDYSDLEEKLQWAIEHDAEASAIAAAGQEAALHQMRDEDIVCYMFILLLEYSVLLKDS